jgi:hypothetical protein
VSHSGWIRILLATAALVGIGHFLWLIWMEGRQDLERGHPAFGTRRRHAFAMTIIVGLFASAAVVVIVDAVR